MKNFTHFPVSVCTASSVVNKAKTMKTFFLSLVLCFAGFASSAQKTVIGPPSSSGAIPYPVPTGCTKVTITAVGAGGVSAGGGAGGKVGQRLRHIHSSGVSSFSVFVAGTTGSSNGGGEDGGGWKWCWWGRKRRSPSRRCLACPYSGWRRRRWRRRFLF